MPPKAPLHPRNSAAIDTALRNRGQARTAPAAPPAPPPKAAKPKAPAPKPAPKAPAKKAAPPPRRTEVVDEPAPEPMRNRTPIRQPMRHVSDADIMREFQGEEADQFYIEPDVIPGGLVYEWKRLEVYGKEDRNNIVEVQKNGWYPVLSEEHDGYFMPPGHKGHIIRGGLGLYAMDEGLYRRRQRYNQLVARDTMHEQQQRLGLAPSGTGPREHPQVRPRVNVDYAQAPDDIEP